MERKELREYVIKEIKKGRTPKEISEELAKKNILSPRSNKIITRKNINNIVTTYKNKGENMSITNKSGSIYELNGRWRFKKIKKGKMIVNKGFKTKQEAEAFQKEFLEELEKKENTPIEEKTKRGPKPKLKQIPIENLDKGEGKNDKGFVVIVGKDPSILNDILTKFDF